MEKLIAAVRAGLDGRERLIQAHEGGDQWVDVAWPWPSEDRPNRMSRTLRVVAPRELIADIEDASVDRQEAAFRRITEAVARVLATFQREHDAPRDVSPPVEELRLTSAEIRP